jgi:peptide chain release factor 2
MRAEAQDHIDKIGAALALLRRFLDWDRAVRRLDELNAKVEDPTLWDSPKAAQEVMRERQRLDAAITATRAIETECADTAELIELAEMEGDEAMVDEAVASLATLAARAEEDKIRALLAGEADANDAYIEVHAGAGGTESQDWAEMLQRMYSRWAEKRGFKVELVEYQAGRNGGHQIGDDAGEGRECLWLCQDRKRRPPPRPHFALRQLGAPPHQLLVGVGLSGD